MMMKLDLEKLEQLAKSATPGRWPNFNDADIREQLWRHYDWDKKRESRSPICIPYSDAEYIAAANPETMLALIERIKKLEAVREAAISNQSTIGAIPWRTRYTNTDKNFVECTQSLFSTWMTTSMTALDEALKACEGGSDG